MNTIGITALVIAAIIGSGLVWSILVGPSQPDPEPGQVWRERETPDPFYDGEPLVRVLAVHQGWVQRAILYPDGTVGPPWSTHVSMFRRRYEFASHAGEPGYTLSAQQQVEIDRTGRIA